MRWVALVGWVALCFAVAAISGSWTAREVAGWYRTLKRPGFAPPNWIFAPVWSALYLMTAVAAWLVWESPHTPMRNLGLALFLAQLGLNFAWPWIFFRKHALGAAAFEIGVLWIAIGATLWTFLFTNSVAGWLLITYFVWVSFAACLNVQFWRLNRIYKLR